MTTFQTPGYNLKAFAKFTLQPKDVQTQELLWTMYEDATYRFQVPQPDIAAGLTILSDLIAIRALSSQPFLHAMTYILFAVNVPYTFDAWCGCKLAHLDKASEILKCIRASHGPECQGCLYVEARVWAGKGIDEEDSDECMCIARLEKVCRIELKTIEDFNWEASGAKLKVDWADKDTEMSDLL